MAYQYQCIISSRSNPRREIIVETKSVIQAALLHGTREEGETVKICSMSGRLISEAVWRSDIHEYVKKR